MLKELTLNLTFVAAVDDKGKETKKTRRFSQVRLDLTDAQALELKGLISELTGEDYISAELTELKLVK
ncbi:DUF1659 domain-containing protein [Macrococcus hajekii]|uniref:DUF1659 domain-containing protein n=1 Tax=Macrococcus hajekii TaxID=198482 RepID=A0A4V3BE85_9STAP|nr:DUF1659 domain-containing protein [Macrococcus hajekii]TDM03085.1 DUF1659 domain-containing protein [Macrococcus hajekii]GGB06413.1 hypothetical protein GCM10007190_13110 [Macrococcus hajekii]